MTVLLTGQISFEKTTPAVNTNPLRALLAQLGAKMSEHLFVIRYNGGSNGRVVTWICDVRSFMSAEPRSSDSNKGKHNLILELINILVEVMTLKVIGPQGSVLHQNSYRYENLRPEGEILKANLSGNPLCSQIC